MKKSPIPATHTQQKNRVTSNLYLRLTLLLIVAIVFNPLTGWTQEISLGIATTGANFRINGLPDPLCGAQSAIDYCSRANQEPDCDGDLPNNVLTVINNSPYSNTIKLEAGKTYNIEAVFDESFGWNLFRPATFDMLVTSNGGASFENDSLIHVDYNVGITTMQGNVRFPLGTTNGAIVFQFTENSFFGQGYYRHNIIIPVLVGGPMVSEIDILGITVEPQIPYIILHDPPGDGSSSSFQETTKSCRSKVSEYSKDVSNNFNLAVRYGFKGSLGFVIELEIEAYVEFSGSGGVGDLIIETNSTETCISIGNGFSTSELPGLGEASNGDVFIGFGRDLYYGMFDMVYFDSCEVIVGKRLAVAPVAGTDRKFVYTQTSILEDIISLQVIVEDTNQTIKARNDALNQIDVWNKVLELNELNKTDPTNEPLEQLVFVGGGSTQTHSKSIEIVDTKSIAAQHYIDGTAGIQGFINVGGSGVAGGWQYTTQERFGKTITETQDSTKLIEYKLSDDDATDNFVVDIVRDPMFGTPIFRLAPNISRSSCPFEGGYQIDQPVLTIANTTEQSIISQGNVEGTSATFNVDLCNESNFMRQYYLKLNAQSNLEGAEVKAAGVALNGNDLGQEFNIAANSCVENLKIEVKQNGSNGLSYPNLEIFLYSLCDPVVSSAINASVFFGDATGTKDILGDENLLSVYPNPTTGHLNVSLTNDGPIDAYKLMDITGKSVSNAELSSPVQSTKMDLSTLPDGIFFLQVRSGQKIFSKKVLVQ